MSDPTAVILARVEVKLDNALAEQTRHSAIIDRHDRSINELGNRVTVLETQRTNDDQHVDRRINSRVVAWTAVGALAMVISVLAAILITKG